MPHADAAVWDCSHVTCWGHVQVKVQAGVRVQDLVDQLRPHGLTLQNFASIREQTIGGFVQVTAPTAHYS